MEGAAGADKRRRPKKKRRNPFTKGPTGGVRDEDTGSVTSGMLLQDLEIC